MAMADDGIFGHELSSFVTLLRSGRQLPAEAAAGGSPAEFAYYPHAGLYRATRGRLAIFGTISKGGCFKVFADDRLLAADAGVAGRLADGRVFCQNNPGSAIGTAAGEEINLEGRCRRLRQNRLSRAAMSGLRILSLLFGWLPAYSQVIRRLMQRVLIFGAAEVPVRFQRQIRLLPDRIFVTDTVRADAPLRELYRTPDLVNLHVVTSDCFQQANLLPWEQLPFDRTGVHTGTREYRA